MQELFVLVAKNSEENSLEVCGCVTRYAAHMFGFPHTSVLLVPVTWDSNLKEPVILMHKRSPYKRTSPNTWDFCGGHLTFDEKYFSGKPWNSLYDLEYATDEAAVREANEELRCTPPFEFLRQHVRRFQSVGYFECWIKTLQGENREFSTAYVVIVPENTEIAVWDTDKEGERKLEVRRFTLSELFDFFERERYSFADGAGRILLRLSKAPKLRSDFEQVLQDVTQSRSRKI
jgi:8-oxo-dGTP pyrophosphatase MutT (NUDIX family)